MTRIAMVILALALAGCVTPAPNTPIASSISEIYKDPWAYHGKSVSVRGTFDECASYTCKFCETENALTNLDLNENMCMGVSFSDESETLTPTKNEEHVALTQNSTESLRERLARFSTSTIIAEYNANCSGMQETPSSDTIIVCTDRASQLRHAKITKTHFRRPASAGVINMYGVETLRIPDQAESRALTEAFLSNLTASPKIDVGQYFLFLEGDSPDSETSNTNNFGGVCVCNLDYCSTDDWPKRLGDILHDTPANPYTCWHAEKVDGAWRFPLQ